MFDVMRVLSLLFFLTLLLDRQMVADSAPGNRAHNRVMMCKVSRYTADNSTFQASRFGGCDICTA